MNIKYYIQKIVSIILVLFIFYIFPLFVLILTLINKKNLKKYFENIMKFLNVKHIMLNNNKIKNGFIISNHSSLFDFIYDTYITDSYNISHIKALLIFPSIFLVYCSSNIFLFNRNNCNRKNLHKKILEKIGDSRTALFYPEGHFKKYNEKITVDILRDNLKYGLLKNIYEDGTKPLQIFITINKGKVMGALDFDFCDVNFNKVVFSKFSNPIYPKDYETFELFIDKIINEWIEIYDELIEYEKNYI
jgi:hypothetical protein